MTEIKLQVLDATGKAVLSLNTEKSVTLKTLRQELVNKLCLDDSFSLNTRLPH